MTRMAPPSPNPRIVCRCELSPKSPTLPTSSESLEPLSSYIWPIAGLPHWYRRRATSIIQSDVSDGGGDKGVGTVSTYRRSSRRRLAVGGRFLPHRPHSSRSAAPGRGSSTSSSRDPCGAALISMWPRRGRGRHGSHFWLQCRAALNVDDADRMGRHLLPDTELRQSFFCRMSQSHWEHLDTKTP